MTRPTFISIALLWLSVSVGFAQYTNIDEATAYINDRLSHSVLQKIDPNGVVTINAPDQKIKFPIREASFNYNGGNDDDRVRVFCNDCIEHYEHKQFKEKTSRQSFLCESEQEANEVITAFRFIKKNFGETAKTSLNNRKIKGADPLLGYTTVSEAIDFINGNLSYSMVMGMDDQGLLTINAPDDLYIINMKQAEFGFNTSTDEPKVRIYGDFCITSKKGQKKEKALSRQSFQAQTQSKAYDVIKALYFLKSTCTNLDPAKIPGLKNLSRNKANTYINIAEAIDFINDRLSYSIILSVDPTGNVSINAPDDIYRFNIHDVKMNKTDRKAERYDWLPFEVPGTFAPGIIFGCNACIKQYDGPGSYYTMDEQVFQCATMNDAKEALKALSYIKSFVKR
jgi:hypothetical protein